MARVKDLLIGVGMSTKGLNRDLGKMRRSFNRSFGEIQKAGRKMSQSLTAPLVGIGAMATKTFVGFEHSMAKVKAVSGATGKEFARLEQSAKALGSTTIFTAQEVSNLQLILAKMGVSAGDIEKTQGSILALAQATDSDLGQAADVVSSTLRAFGKDMDQGSHLSDVMAASFSNSALSMDSFSNAMGYVAPVANKAGVSIEETTAMLAILANNGIRGSKAGRALRRILTDVGKTGKPVSVAIKEMADKGLDLEQAMDEVGRSAQTQLLVLADNIDSLPGLATGYERATGSAQEMAATMDATTFGAFKRMTSAIEGVALKIGSIMAPTLERLSVIVSNAMGMISSMSPSMQKLAVVGAAVAAAIGPILVLVPSLVSGFGMVAGILSGPVLLAIGAVVGAVLLIRSRWEQIRAYFTNGPGAKVLDTLKNSVLAAVQSIINIWDALVGFLTAAWDMFGQDIIDATTRSFNFVAKRFSRVASFLSNVFNALAAALSGDWGTMWDRIKNLAVDAVVFIIEGTEFLVAELLRLVDWGLSYLGAETDMAGAFESMVSDAVGYLDGLKTPFEETAVEATSMFDTLELGFSKLFSGGGGVVAPTLQTDETPQTTDTGVGPAELQMPSADMDPPDTTKWSSWANGMRDMMGNLTTFTDTLRDSAAQMGDALGSAFSAAASGAEDAKEQLKGALKGIVDTSFAAATAHIIQANAAAAIGSGLAAPVVAPILISAGMAMVRGAFGAVTGFKDGGIVSGPTMGLVAEYPGARNNPEVIAPLDKLQSMIGNTGGNMSAVLRGRDIVLSNERGGYSRRRAFG